MKKDFILFMFVFVLVTFLPASSGIRPGWRME